MRIAPLLATLCVILAAAASADARPRRHAHAPAAAPAAGPAIAARIGRDHDVLVLTVTITNRSTVPLCAMPDYVVAGRVTATRRGRAIQNQLAHQPAPPARAQCLRLNPGEHTGVDYGLNRLYSGSLRGARLCYSFPWRRIDQQTPHQASGCSTVP